MPSETARIATLVLYYAVLALLAMYGTHRAMMVRLYYRHRRDVPHPAGELPVLPRVTIQLPIYNEVYVVERLIEAVAAIDYPRALLEIQVLDDSTDETREVARRVVARYRALGFEIAHRTREDRKGFKAGALQAGLEAARGEFLMIFDADFLPTPEIVRASLPYFSDPSVGMVQARWEHLNRDYSLLTRIQSIFLDGHFVIEHTARHRSGRFFNFNGTAGIWRRRCLEEIGGWQSDTLTEDLDISYRAQLAGWKFVYLKDLVVPAELPVDMNGFKSQQHRWTKGSIQTGRKLLPAIFKSRLSVEDQGRGVFPPYEQFLPPPRRAAGPPHHAGDHHPGTDRLEAPRRPGFPPLLRGDLLLYRVLHRVAEGDWPRLEGDAPVNAAPAFARDRVVTQ